MGYDRGERFSFDFEPNGNQFGSIYEGRLSQRPYPIQFERRWKYSFLSVRDWVSEVGMTFNYLMIRSRRNALLIRLLILRCFILYS